MFNQSSDFFDVESNMIKLHKKMKDILKPIEWKVYLSLYVQNKSEKEVAHELGYKTSEKNRSPGYKQIKNIKKSIIEKVKKVLKSGDVDLY